MIDLQPLEPIPPQISGFIVDDERLMQAFGLQGTPGIVFRLPTGQLAARPGLSPEELPAVLGPL